MSELLLNTIKSHKAGKPVGVFSVCSANKYVLEASMIHAKRNNYTLLIEATSNQVDQYGGYTGLKPMDFKRLIENIAHEVDYPFSNIILGGDHLGPNVWRNEPSNQAMEKAFIQVKEYVKAGFTKIHIDTSMKCADDTVNENNMLSPEIATERAALLCKAAEEAARSNDLKAKPVYVIGTDVPIPGGALHDMENIRITPVSEVEETITFTRNYFEKFGLNEAWKRTVAVVVQPGVEFSDSRVAEYNTAIASELSNKINEYENLVYEAHSTDYQTKFALKKLVEDHFAILKVGPWLTFAFREAIFALAMIEEELSTIYNNIKPSNIRGILISVMNNNPVFWKKYYNGNRHEIKFAQKYSFSDRIRYYWTYKEVNDALQTLIKNLSEIPIPLNLLSQYMPLEAEAVMEGKIENKPKDLIYSRIMSVLDKYFYAVNGGKE